MGNATTSSDSNSSMMDLKKYGIADAMTEMMESAIMADANAAQRAYDLIRQHAYTQDVPLDDSSSSGSMNNANKTGNTGSSDSSQLAMAYFTMQDSDGKTRQVGIPKITMMPLPLLHVTEASFSIKLTVNFDESSTKNENTEAKTLIRDGWTEDKILSMLTLDDRVRRGLVKGRRPLSSLERTKLLKNLQILRNRGVSTSSGTTMSVINNTTDTTTSTTTDLNVTVKMEQADLPAGIQQLLQAAANNLQIS